MGLEDDLLLRAVADSVPLNLMRATERSTGCFG